MSKRLSIIIVCLVVAFVTTLTIRTMGTRQSETVSLNSESANSEQVVEMLNQIDVQEESDLDYPDNFGGAGWKQKSNCKTDALVLKVESRAEISSTTGKCKPVTGYWISPYDGNTWTQASKLEIDHMVPKREAWESGASAWTDARREAFKNDRGYGPSLIAVTEHENASKGDEEPGFERGYYLPPLASYRCTYVAEWIAVKWRWSLSVDVIEKANLEKLMNSCTGEIHIPMPKKV